MSFAQPQILPFAFILILVTLLFTIWSNKRKQAAILKLGSEHLVERLSESTNKSGRRWKTRLWFFVLILLLLALARPLWGSEVQIVEQQGIQVMLALDISPSMLTEDVKPNRLTRAKLEIMDLLGHLTGDEVGLVLFSGASFIQFPLTSDYATARSFIEAADPSVISKAGTAIGEAIQTAMMGFDDKRASQKVIILFTDGEDHEAGAKDIAQQASEKGIKIYTIGVGTNQGEPIPEFDEMGEVKGYKRDQQGEVVLSKLDTAVLQAIAEVTGGKFYLTCASGSEINSLVSELETMQKETLESQFEIHGVERFQVFLVIALICLVIIEIIPERLSNEKITRNYNE